jgi:hypothetical protein
MLERVISLLGTKVIIASSKYSVQSTYHLIKESIKENTHLRMRQIDDDRAVGSTTKGEAYVVESRSQ